MVPGKSPRTEFYWPALVHMPIPQPPTVLEVECCDWPGFGHEPIPWGGTSTTQAKWTKNGRGLFLQRRTMFFFFNQKGKWMLPNKDHRCLLQPLRHRNCHLSDLRHHGSASFMRLMVQSHSSWNHHVSRFSNLLFQKSVEKLPNGKMYNQKAS